MGVWLMKKAVAYARYSSDNQNELSIIAQFRAIEEYAEKEGITIVRKYYDEAKSASVFATKPRLEFEQMLDDIMEERVKIDYVLFHKLDRFGRNDYDIARFKHFTRQKGIKIIYVDMSIPEGPEGVIMEQMLIGWAQYYSLNLSREIRKGMKERALLCKHRGGTPPLGYDVNENKEYAINPEEARAVRLIFEMVKNGEGYSKIIDTLNSLGYKTKKGKPFGKNSLHEILRNEKYAGIYVAGKYSAGSTDGKIIEEPGGVPAIVPLETWEAVQEIMKNRKHTQPRRRKETGSLYILTGKAFCGECGGAYTGNSRLGGRNKKSRYSIYNCTNKSQKRGCDNKDIQKELLESYVLDELERIFKMADVEELADKIISRHQEQHSRKIADIGACASAIAKVKSRMDRLFEAIETGTLDSAVAGPRLNALAKEKEQLEKNLLKITSQQRPTLSREGVIQYLRKNLKILDNREDIEECRKMIEYYVGKVIITKDSIEIKFNLPYGDGSKGGNKKGDVDKGGGPEGCLTLTTSAQRSSLRK